MPDFLLEVGLEEVPARMIDAASEEVTRRVRQLLARERLANGGEVHPFSTPRRLSVLARGIASSQPDVEEQVLGPSLKVSFKDGQATSAAHAFARKVGVPVEKLQKITTPKGDYLAANVVNRGRTAAEVLAEALPREIAAIYWPKNMYWRSKGERFARPVRWLVALLDGDVAPMELFGIPAQAGTHGHRILGGPITIPRASAYAETLAAVKVVVDRSQREQRIRKALDAAARSVAGARWREDAGLLNTVVNLTEWPSALLGNFDREFLSLPEEVLVTVMRDHQKYFAVEDASGKLAPHFLAVLNTEGDPAGIIRHGNERVLRARFRDARFFWDTDQKISLKQRVDMLKSVTFQKELGSYYAKAERMAHLVGQLADSLGLDAKSKTAAIEAARLAKADLTTELVKEFTELQGVVGGLYARAQGLPVVVADAIYDHYKPQSMEEASPRTIEGALVSIADKADSIAGMFALGLIPSGSKDPFALRRQANGIVKTIAEHALNLGMRELLLSALQGYREAGEEGFGASAPFTEQVTNFFRERLEFYLKDVLGLEYDTVNAVLAASADDVVDAVARAKAVSQARQLEDFEHIAVAFKRTKNILRQAQETNRRVAEQVDVNALTDATAIELQRQAAEIAQAVERYRASKDYLQALQVLAGIRPHVDAFFDKVMVMVENEQVRANRLALLRDLLRDFSTIADFSEIVTEGK